MPNFINIAKDNAPPVLINAEDVTSISINEKDQTAGISDTQGGRLHLTKDNDRWGVDIATLPQKMADAGCPLVCMTCKHPSHDAFPWYISPQAVTFITVSKEDADDGTVSVIIGVKGIGHLTSYGASRAEVDALVDAVRQTGKTLLAFDPAEAKARWMNAEKLYIVPSEIVRMQGDGSLTQLNVYFDGCGYLDVNTSGPDRQAIWRQLKAENPGKEFDDLIEKVYEREDALSGTATKALADKLAAAKGTLTAIEGGKCPVHFNPAEVMRAYTLDVTGRQGTEHGAFDLIIEMHPPKGSHYPEPLRTAFNTAAERQTAMDKALPSVKKNSATKNKPA